MCLLILGTTKFIFGAAQYVSSMPHVVEINLCWSDALFYCRDRGQDLLSVHSQEEQDMLKKTLSVSLVGHVWLGLRRQVFLGLYDYVTHVVK